jgi:hypothetical protein
VPECSSRLSLPHTSRQHQKKMLSAVRRSSAQGIARRAISSTSHRTLVRHAGLSTSTSTSTNSSAGLARTGAALATPLAGLNNVHKRTMSHHAESTERPAPDQVLQDIADYVHDFNVDSELALETARLCLIDTLGCGLEGLQFPECASLLGPVVEGTTVPNGESKTGTPERGHGADAGYCL